MMGGKLISTCYISIFLPLPCYLLPNHTEELTDTNKNFEISAKSRTDPRLIRRIIPMDKPWP